jgi:predicted amidohydrolase YtcJ
MQDKLRTWSKTPTAAKLGWIIGNGYDDSQLKEQRHPTRQDLDAVSTEIPIVVIHQSGHLAAVNSKGLELAGITATTKTPAGGVIRRQMDNVYKHNIQAIIHSNGDASTDQLIMAVRKATEKYGQADRRTVLIHGQTVREDQLDEMKKLGIFPALFPAHTFYWGDWHREVTLGSERAARISPTRSALKRGMKVTIHTDSPVVLPHGTRTIWSAVNRRTRSGFVLGKDQCLTPLEALKAITIWSAYQHFEEKQKGSIEVGKLADFAILSGNPLTIDPMKIKDIAVLETIKEGKTIFKT